MKCSDASPIARQSYSAALAEILRKMALSFTLRISWGRGEDLLDGIDT